MRMRMSRAFLAILHQRKDLVASSRQSPYAAKTCGHRGEEKKQSDSVCATLAKVVAQIRLRMIRRASEVGVENLLAVRLVVALAGRFRGHKNGIDFGQHLRIVKGHRPTVLPRIVSAKDAQAVRNFLDASLAAPNVEYDV